jgi:uncharacterized protein GlcG (DUF336 family)
MTNVVKKYSISYELAQRMVDAAVAKARELGVSENVAILDDGGNLKAFGRRSCRGDRAKRCAHSAERHRLRKSSSSARIR